MQVTVGRTARRCSGCGPRSRRRSRAGSRRSPATRRCAHERAQREQGRVRASRARGRAKRGCGMSVPAPRRTAAGPPARRPDPRRARAGSRWRWRRCAWSRPPRPRHRRRPPSPPAAGTWCAVSCVCAARWGPTVRTPRPTGGTACRRVARRLAGAVAGDGRAAGRDAITVRLGYQRRNDRITAFPGLVRHPADTAAAPSC